MLQALTHPSAGTSIDPKVYPPLREDSIHEAANQPGLDKSTPQENNTNLSADTIGATKRLMPSYDTRRC